MGNITRMHALIEQILILNPNQKIHILTSGVGLDYYRTNDFKNVSSQNSLNIENKSVYGSLAFFFLNLVKFLKLIYKNYKIQKKLIQENKFDVVFFDSDYGFILHRILNRNFKIIAINNSYEIVNYRLSFFQRLKHNLAYSFLFEKLDLLIHSVFTDSVICPSLQQKNGLHVKKSLCSNIYLTPPLVRKQITAERRRPDHQHTLLMTTGSAIQNPLSDSIPNSKLTILGCRNLNFKNFDIFINADVVVCNAGQSTLAEILYTNKSAFCCPIPNHYEQFVNFDIVSKYGVKHYLEFSNSSPDNLETFFSFEEFQKSVKILFERL